MIMVDLHFNIVNDKKHKNLLSE